MVDKDESLTDKGSGKVKQKVVHGDDPRGVGVGSDEHARPTEDEHVVPPGADDEVQRAEDWVKADGPPRKEQQQREGDGFR